MKCNSQMRRKLSTKLFTSSDILEYLMVMEIETNNTEMTVRKMFF